MPDHLLLLVSPEPGDPPRRFVDFWDAFFNESATSDQEVLHMSYNELHRVDRD